LVVWLDLEPLREGEDEIGAAVRLLQRVLQRYPRAFDLTARQKWPICAREK
jgi:hypothetical protein